MKTTIPSLKKAMMKLGMEIERMSVDMVESIATDIATKAAENFDKAEYDGDKGVISIDVTHPKPQTFMITASGESVEYIEYGSGVRYTGGYPGDLPPGYEYKVGPNRRHNNEPNSDGSWYFDDPDLKASLSAGGKRYNITYRRQTKEDIESGIRVKGKLYDTEEFMSKYKGGKYKGKYPEKRRVAVVRTYGNKPNACMYNAMRDSVQNDLPELIRRFKEGDYFD